MLPLDEAAPAAEVQDPIDLVSDTSESTDESCDSDDSSAVVAVEPIDQAAAEVPVLGRPLSGMTSLNFCSTTRMRQWLL